MSVNEFVEIIRSRSQMDNFEFDSNERLTLLHLLDTFIPQMNARELTSTITSLGVCSQSDKRPNLSGHHRQLILIRNKLLQLSDQFNERDMALIFVGLARINCDWNVLFSRTKQQQEQQHHDPSNSSSTATSAQISDFLKRLSFLLETHMDAQLVGDTIWSLGALDAQYADLPVFVKSSLLSAFEKKATSLNSYSLSSALWALSKLGVKWSLLSDTMQSTLPSRLMEISSGFSPQQSSKVIWALGNMGVKHTDTPAAMLEYHLLNVGKIKRSKMGSAVPASQTLMGLAKMGFTWEALSVQMRNELWEQLTRVCQSTNDRGITNAVWAVGTIGAPASAIPADVQRAMLAGAIQASSDCSAWALCNIVWGLAKMKFDWHELPSDFKETIMRNVVRLERDFNSVDVGILLWSLGSMDATHDALPKYFFTSLLQATHATLEEMKPEELSRTMWGLSSLDVSWDSLPPSVRWGLNVALRRVGSKMTPQCIANCAYGLAILSFDTRTPSDPAFRGAHEVLLNTIINARREGVADDGVKVPVWSRQREPTYLLEQEFEQLRIFAHYLSVNRFVTETNRIPAKLLAKATREEFSTQGSRLQDRVVRGLQDGFLASTLADQFDITLESSSFGGVFPVDAMISKNGEIVALIEIDGPHHYRADGSLRRKDQLKEAMYQKQHPDSTFHRIRWDDANKLGSDVVGEELASLVMSNSRQVGPLTGLFRKVGRDVSSFFAWGLRNDDS